MIPKVYIHESAVIDGGVSIGAGSKIWHFCHIMPDAVIGCNCSLGQNVFVGQEVRIGDNVKIQNNVSIYEGVTCEDDVFIGPSAVFTNVRNPRSSVSRKEEFLPTLLRKGVSIGANATILCGVEIGEFAFIGAGTVVLTDIQPFEMIVGNPGKRIGWMSEQGQRLVFDLSGKAHCHLSGQQYQLTKEEILIKIKE